jgi:hypothetical protein
VKVTIIARVRTSPNACATWSNGTTLGLRKSVWFWTSLHKLLSDDDELMSYRWQLEPVSITVPRY